LIQNSKQLWPTDLLSARAEYFIKQWIVLLLVSAVASDKHNDAYTTCMTLAKLLETVGTQATRRQLITHDKVQSTWEKHGPVVSQLLLWLRRLDEWDENGEPRATCFTEMKRIVLELPCSSCGGGGVEGKRVLEIETRHFGDYGHNYDRELSVKAKCGNVQAKCECISLMDPDDMDYVEEDEFVSLERDMDPILEILSDELGVCVDGRFFFWLCFHFPDGSCPMKEKLQFKEASRNSRVSVGTVRSAIQDLHRSIARENGGVDELLAKWKRSIIIQERDEANQTAVMESADMISECIRVLSLKEDGFEALHTLSGKARRLYCMASDYGLRDAPKDVLVELLQRTTMDASRGYGPGAIADKYVSCKVLFRCKHPRGGVMRVSCGVRGDGASYPTWEELDLEFILPNGERIHQRASNPDNPLKGMDSISEIVRECVGARVSPMFVVVFFLTVLECPAADCFLPEEYDYEVFEEVVEEELEDENYTRPGKKLCRKML